MNTCRNRQTRVCMSAWGCLHTWHGSGRCRGRSVAGSRSTWSLFRGRASRRRTLCGDSCFSRPWSGCDCTTPWLPASASVKITGTSHTHKEDENDHECSAWTQQQLCVFWGCYFLCVYLIYEGDKNHCLPFLLLPIQIGFEIWWIVLNDWGILTGHQVLK